MVKKQPRIIFFINGANATAEETEEAESCGNNVVLRNACMVPKECNPERCDGVAGSIPEAYKKLPRAKGVLKKFEDALKAARKKEIERLKEKEKLNEKKRAAAKKAAEKVEAAKKEKAAANKKIAEARQEAANVQSVGNSSDE